MGGCSAPNCTNHSSSKNASKRRRMFRFPADNPRRQVWVQNCRRDAWTPGNGAYLCQDHFEPDQFEQHRLDGWKKLKPSAVPTIFSVPNPPKCQTGSKCQTAEVLGLQKMLPSDFINLDHISVSSAVGQTTHSNHQSSYDFHYATDTSLISSSSSNILSTVCELHFQESDFERETSATDPKTGITISCKLDKVRLKKNALPSIFPVFDAKLRSRKKSSKESAPSKCSPVKKRQSRGKVQGTINKRRTAKNGNKDPLTEILNYSSANSNSKLTEKYEFSTSNETSVFSPEVILKAEKLNQEEEIIEEISDQESDDFGHYIYDDESEEENNDAVSSTTKRPSPVPFTPYKISKREEVFGRFVACEMSDISKNPALYLKVQQSILKTLVEAQFELISSEL